MPVKLSVGENKSFASKSRFRILRFTIYLLGIVFFARLMQLQFLQADLYSEISQNQSIKQKRVEPIRGNFYDEKNHLIVHSKPSFSLTITPKEFKKESLPLLANLLKTDTLTIINKLESYKNYSPFKPVKIFKDLPDSLISGIEEFNRMLPGVSISIESKRNYSMESNLTHALGYIGEISQKQLNKKQYYNPGDAIGRSGLEFTYEDLLKGKFGISYETVNKFGKRVKSFDEGKRDSYAQRGFDVYLKINDSLQALAEELLDGRRGAIVAMDPRDGGIYAMVSKPDYNLEDFSGRIKSEVYSELLNDNGKPLIQRATSSSYPPGSSWKMLVALAGLQEGLIDINKKYLCTGGMKFGNRYFRCTHTDGYVNVVNAIRSSCNVYFYELGLELGVEKMIEYGNIFRFGEKTKIDLPFESKGNFPSYERLKKKYNGTVPKGLALNWGIGQGEILTTPLQMAVYTSALANRGRLVQPHLVDKVFNHYTKKFEEISYDAKKVEIEEKYFDIVLKGMYKVVNEEGGTARNAALPGLDVCGKTSTAQNPHGKPHAWFVSFAPYKDPKLVVVVMVENAGYGGAISAPMAREIHKKFFNISIPKPVDQLANEEEHGEDHAHTTH